MKVKFNLDGIRKEDGHFESLTRIIGTIADGWHEWTGPPPEDLIFEQYFELHPQYAELASKSFSQALAYSRPDTRVIEVVLEQETAAPHADRYALNRAFDYLAQPLKVLVENEIADGHFFLEFISAIDQDLASRFSEARPPITFDQGGGNMEVLNLVKSRVARAAQHGLRPRLVVLADSDSRYPGHLPSDTNKLLAACNVERVPVHVTEKRSQENYIPDEVFLAIANGYADLAPAVAFIISLSSTQRDHYPIKTGLPSNLSDGEKTLYFGRTMPVGAPLRVARIAEYFRTQYSLAIEAAHLNARVCTGEFERIVELLRREL